MSTDNDNRGKIQNRKRAKQLRDFSGLHFGKISPTDIDATMDFHNKGYVFVETKVEDTPLPRGQELALERLCDDLQKIKPTLVIVAEHNYPPGQDIDMAKCKVKKYRYMGRWQPTRTIQTVRQLIESFFKKLETSTR